MYNNSNDSGRRICNFGKHEIFLLFYALGKTLHYFWDHIFCWEQFSPYMLFKLRFPLEILR
jgi:hypothetical protein